MTRKRKQKQLWLFRSNALRGVWLRVASAWARWRASRAASRARIDPNAKCPACGARNGRIKWLAASALVQHTCLDCAAIWCEPPLMEGFGDFREKALKL